MSLIHKVTALPVLVLLAMPLSACQKEAETAPETVTTDSPDLTPTTEPTNDATTPYNNHNAHNDAHDNAHNGRHDEHNSHVSDHNHAHEHHHTTEAMTTYSCQPEQTIKVHYDTGKNTANSTPRGAHLLIDDIEYEFTPMLTTLAAGVANAVVYETDIGINDDAGMYWQVNGNQANLVNKTLDGNTLPENEKTLFTCEQAAS
jgi:ABC-type Zn2+ transport system substrate-binding protein/surface adhesin